MQNIIKILVVLVAMNLSQASFADTVYKCETPSGMTYQHAPCATNAKSNKIETRNEPKRSVCDNFSIASAKIMAARQNGTDMSSLLSNVLSGQTIPEVRQMIRNTVIRAYDSPQYSSTAVKLNAVNQFKNDNYLACTKSGLDNMK